jgi:hypothetical protein
MRYGWDRRRWALIGFSQPIGATGQLGKHIELTVIARNSHPKQLRAVWISAHSGIS